MRSETEAKVPVACGRLFHQQARAGHCFTDFWSAYQAVIPENQQTAAGKETGETARAGTVEYYPPTTLGALCSQNAVFC